jgi:uroporphyrinogen decarboxylase
MVRPRMTSNDLFRESLQRQSKPVAIWRHHPVADQSADGLAGATLAFQSRFPSDIVKITPASSFQLRDFGQTDSFDGDRLGRRDFGGALVSEPKDWLDLIAIPTSERHLSIHFEAARLLRSSIPEDIPLVQTIFDPMFQARILARGVWDEHVSLEPDLIETVLDALTARTVRMIETFREIGVDGIFMAVQHAGMSDYRRLGLPRALACLDATGENALNFLHLHGAGLEGWLATAFPEAIVHASFDESPELLAECLRHPHLVFAGGLSPDFLAKSTATEVSLAARDILRRMENRRFVLSTGCVLLPDTPAANIDALLGAARREESALDD